MFKAVKNQDVRSTYIAARNLYAISADFQDDQTGDTPLHVAVRLGNHDLMKHLLAIYPALADVPNNLGHTPVMESIGQPGMFELFKDMVKEFTKKS